MLVETRLSIREKLSEGGDREQKTKRRSDGLERRLEGSNMRKKGATQSSS